ncbi:MAG: alpha/beta hydrolase [Erythrobacter sp.]
MAKELSWSPDPKSGIEIEWIDANGLTFEVATAGPKDAKKFALCLHGFPELHYSWRHQIPMLAEMGFRVWAPNMRGYGGTTRPKGIGNYRVSTLAEDVGALIDVSGAEEVTLIAHDWGAIVAWYFAIAKVRPLTRLVICNVPHPLCAQREIKHWHQLKKSWYIFFFQLPWLPELLVGRNGGRELGALFAKTSCNPENFTAEVQEIYAKAARQPGAMTAMFDYYRALLRRSDSDNLGGGKVDVPTLVLWGEQDVAIDIRCLDGTDEYVRDLTVQRFPDASHWVQQDVPDEVNAELKEWLMRS